MWQFFKAYGSIPTTILNNFLALCILLSQKSNNEEAKIKRVLNFVHQKPRFCKRFN